MLLLKQAAAQPDVWLHRCGCVCLNHAAADFKERGLFMKKFFNLLDSFRDLLRSLHTVLSSYSVSVRLFYFLYSVFSDVIFIALFIGFLLCLGIIEIPA